MRNVVITDALTLIAECQAPETGEHARLLVTADSIAMVYVYCHFCLQQPTLLEELSRWLADGGPPYLLTEDWTQFPVQSQRCAWCLNRFPEA